jgi:uncharacterized protein YkwD
MNSAGHRAAILRAGVTDFGFGIASRDGVIYAVEVFVRSAPVPDATAR